MYPLTSGKGKDSPVASPKGARHTHPRAPQTLILALQDSLQTSDLRDCKRINLCCLKPLSVWSFVAEMGKGYIVSPLVLLQRP